MMKYLGIDYGMKRIGIAVSDEGGDIAFPREILKVRRNDAVDQIVALIAKERISRVVVGMPLTLQGRAGMQAMATKRFISILMRCVTVPVVTENEVLTTKIARGSPGARQRVDASAAALLLQSYIDRQRQL